MIGPILAGWLVASILSVATTVALGLSAEVAFAVGVVYGVVCVSVSIARFG